MRRHYYRADGVNKGGGEVQVELVTLPANYLYARHDFYGMLRTVTKNVQARAVRAGSTSESEGEWLLVDWNTDPARKGGPVYFCYVTLTGRADKGLAAWYSTNDSRPYVVAIRYIGRTGLPRELIDKYLAQYPSTVDPAHYAGEGWVREDIQTWMQVIGQASPPPRLQMMLINSWLRRYDPDSFGLGSLDAERANLAEYRIGAEQTVSRMQTWLDEQSKPKTPEEP